MAMFVMILITSKVSNYCIQKKWTTIQFSRKLFNSFGMWLPAIFLLALGFVPVNATMSIFLITITIGLNAATHSGFVINHLDLAPNFAGILVGTCIAIGNFASIGSPLLVGYVVTDTVNGNSIFWLILMEYTLFFNTNQNDLASWRIIFIVAACIFFVCNLVFIAFGKVDIQHWNNPKEKIVKIQRCMLN